MQIDKRRQRQPARACCVDGWQDRGHALAVEFEVEAAHPRAERHAAKDPLHQLPLS